MNAIFTYRPKLSAILAACLAGLSAGAVQAQAVDPAARAALPPAMRQSGVLKVAGAMIYPPFNWMDKGRITGAEIELITVLARKLGLQPQFNDIKFATLIPSIRNGRFDVALGQIGITPKRQKVVSFVPDYVTGYTLLVRKGPTDIDINNLCGRRLAATVGSGQLKVVGELSEACVRAGRKPIEYDVYGDPLNTYLALANGRGEGYMVARAPGLYIAKRLPKLRVMPGVLKGRTMYSGLVVGKDKPEFRHALSLALQSAGRDGSYRAVLRRYGIEDGALTDLRLPDATPAPTLASRSVAP